MASCRDGTNTMTCLPLSLKPVEYMCVCSAEKGNLNTGIRWDDNWEEITECRVPVLKRSLCDAQSGWCLGGMFWKNLVYLVKTYAPLDSQITVSSEYTTDFAARKARLEYNGDVCAWRKATDDNNPWIKFDLLKSRVAIGVNIGKTLTKTLPNLRGTLNDAPFNLAGSTNKAPFNLGGHPIKHPSTWEKHPIKRPLTWDGHPIKHFNMSLTWEGH